MPPIPCPAGFNRPALAISPSFLLHILLHVRSRPHPFAPICGHAHPAHLIENIQNQGLLLDLKTLASGFSKDVYDRAMQVGLRLTKIDDRKAALPLTQKKYMFQAVGLRNARA